MCLVKVIGIEMGVEVLNLQTTTHLVYLDLPLDLCSFLSAMNICLMLMMMMMMILVTVLSLNLMLPSEMTQA